MNHDIKCVRLPSGVERYELRVWWDGWNAKQIKRRFETKKDAQNYLYELAKAPSKETVLSGETSFHNLYLFWLENRAKREFAPGWLSTIEGYWSQLQFDFSNKEVSQITPSFLKSLEGKLLGGGNSKKTVRNKVGFILAVLNYAKIMKLIVSHPCEDYVLPKIVLKKIEYWDVETAQDFMRAMNEKYPIGDKHRWVYSFYLTALNTGLRSGELWALRPICLKRTRGVIEAYEQFNRVSGNFTETKGKVSREVPLNEIVLNELDAQIRARGLRSHDLIFTNNGKPTCHDNFAKRDFAEDLKFWGGRVITLHGLRHTAATLMLWSGVDLKTVQEILGHKDIKTTMRYLHKKSAASVNEKFKVEASKLAPILRVVE